MPKPRLVDTRRGSTHSGLSVLSSSHFTDAEALATVACITGGNFLLVQRLCAQTQRIMAINNLSMVTKEDLETARESVVIGSL